jgi:ADP-ribose pyrophosphatase YjhB (NUDIX family)
VSCRGSLDRGAECAHDLGERIAETVVREVEGETGLDVEVTGIVGICSDPAADR